MSEPGDQDAGVVGDDSTALGGVDDLVGTLDITHLSVSPGSSVPLPIAVANTGQIIDGVTALVDGLDPDWVRLAAPLVSVFPGESSTVEVWFDIPPDCASGDYLVNVRLVSTINPERQSFHDFWLTVLPVNSLDLDLVPQIVTGGTSATLTASVRNTGNTVANVHVDAFEGTRQIEVEVDPPAFFIPSGESAQVEISMRGRRPWFGQPDARSLLVTARVEEFSVEETATFTQRPRVSRGLLTMLILAGILLLWALVFLLAFDRLSGEPPVSKAVGTEFATGQTDIPLALVAASVDGTVSAATTGQGVPRVSVEAFRITADGTLAASGSAATGDEGTYSLTTLLPGTYVFRVVGEGFDSVWYPGVADQAAAESVRLEPRGTQSGLDLVLTGELGEIVGQVELPPNTPVVPLTVTATQLGASGDAGADGVTVTQETTDGTIALADLPTPATYQVTVEGDGFESLSFDQEVRGGSPTVINTVNLTAASGQVSGTVVDQSDTPVGDVMVTIRSGDFSASATTPTAGNTGAFTFVGLETPATYTLSFEAPFYSDTTLALELEPGASAEGVVARIVGGDGTITGSARNADGSPAGGLTVEVVGDGFRQETATLTSSGAGGAAGSFLLANVPVPGVYSVSLSGPAVQTETLDAAFLAAGTVSVGEVVMVPVTSEVSGRVLSGGGGIGQATVTLSDGVREFVTVSASNPLGLYTFGGVAEGSYTITVEQTGFETHVVLIAVVAGVDVVRDIEIGPPVP